MGALPWYYFTPYQPDIYKVFLDLRRREFNAGRYYPAVKMLQFPVLASSPSPGAKHHSIEEAIEAAGPNGTRSILDIQGVSLKGPASRGTVAPLSTESLLELYGTKLPTREMVEQNMDFFAELERGHGVFLVVFKQGQPDEILFAGYSYD